MKRNIYIANLNIAPFVPYISGILRMHSESDPAAADYEFRDPIFHRSRPDSVVGGLADPAILGLSCYVWNFRQHMKIARLCKERFPQCLTVAGGPHVPDNAEEFLRQNPYIDLAVHGEGESAFSAILREGLSPRPDWSAVPGISFMRAGEMVATPTSRLDLQELHDSPYLVGHLDSAIKFFKDQGTSFYAPWETNRGCPYSCSFCDWGSATMSKVRRFDMARLLAEADYFGVMQVPIVHINDANFGLLGRDIEIAEALVHAREKYGFPREVRLNFAKNSNDRVFEISKMWHESGLLNTTTLSMQATTEGVLEAINRKNIPMQQYRQLQDRYTRAGIRTYTEVILGLPSESRNSFKRGLDYVLEMGNHEDIRIYELSILPNAPMANPQVMKAYGIEVIEKHLMPKLPGAPETPADEIEIIPTVISTDSMSRADWVDCSVYARLLQFLHAQGLTRYLAMHLHRQYEINYSDFYGRLQENFRSRPTSTIGAVLAVFYDFYERFQSAPEIPQIDTASGPTPNSVAKFLRYRQWVSPTDWAWLSLALNRDAFFAELRDFLPVLGCSFGPEMPDVLQFQQDIILSPDYDEQLGKRCSYAHDLPAYVTGSGALRRCPTTIHFRDRHVGPGRKPLRKNDPARFVNAALPGDWSAAHGHYQHQLSNASITYAGPLPSSVVAGASDNGHAIGVPDRGEPR